MAYKSSPTLYLFSLGRVSHLQTLYITNGSSGKEPRQFLVYHYITKCKTPVFEILAILQYCNVTIEKMDLIDMKNLVQTFIVFEGFAKYKLHGQK